MALIATEGDRFSNVVPWLAFPAERFHFDVVTVNVADAGTLAFGTVLAKVTSTGKYIVQDSSLASGSGLESAGILVGDDLQNLGSTVAANTDKKVLLLARGPAKIVKTKLVFGSGTDTAAEKLVEYNRLASLGLVAVDQA